ncbi:hypothetical protein PR003_g14842 [Phytophthora rubi]|uniref:Pectate lyase n=1 Tax=Phytophthora rubi TaxID=129364 RepID=A0A6A4F2T9_9STRA|nr:hypothetical protein PR001_g13835 [Phytophthora rubi]KAE9036213.1 hypothetical protein PR002_g7189 [Phytophthora rubi]KAE9331777.1 hypothetical protein PR003_g14842 [Phytophthora rubi]
MIVWMAVGLGPFLLQLRSFATFVKPHKISEQLVAPANAKEETHKFCPVKEWLVAGARCNTKSTHYYRINNRILCRTTAPQYNAHGMYILENTTVEPYNATYASCSGQTTHFHGNFYHGSIGYFAIYAETQGIFCSSDNTAYIAVSGRGTYDINGQRLAHDRGEYGYRKSYWNIFTGTT